MESSEAEPTEREGERRNGWWLEGGGIRVCDCQLWERDPLGGVKVQEKRKSKRVKKREQVNRDMWRKKRGEEMEENVVLM